MEVLVEPLRTASDRDWLRALVQLREKGRKVLLVRELAEQDPVESRVLAVAEADGTIAWGRIEASFLPDSLLVSGPPVRFIERTGDRDRLLLEAISPVDRMIIVGGGHIGKALAAIAPLLRFEVTIVDEREEFSDRERFPLATEVLHGDPGAILETVPGGESGYFVLVSHGYPTDARALRTLLRKPARYVGMIGSRRRVEMVRRALSKDGLEREFSDRVYAPIGLAVGAETPEEIAVSIAAEIIAVRNGLGRSAGSLSATRVPG
jgi:xanthine dehydrogenase accessory factor